MATLVAVLTERDAKILLMLLDMVSIRRRWVATDSAGHRLDRSQVSPLCLRELVIHLVALS
jgi:hypothetical protein